MAEGTTKAEPLHTHVVRFDNTDPGSPSAIQRLPTVSVVLNEPVITVEVTASKARGLKLTVGAMKFAAALFSTPVEVSNVDRLTVDGAGTSGRNLGGGLGQNCFAPPPQMHLGTMGDQSGGHSAAQAGAAAGDQNALAVQHHRIENACHSPKLLPMISR